MPKIERERVILGYTALLHDIGKAFQRTNIQNTEYAWKLFQYLSLTGNESHEKIGERIINWFLDEEIPRGLYEYIRIADRASASERAGIFTMKKAKCINQVIQNIVKQYWKTEYRPSDVPLLTPLWLLALPKNIMGDKDYTSRDAAEIFKEFFSLSMKLNENQNEEIFKEFCEKLYELLSPIWKKLIYKDSKYWIPVIPLDDENAILDRLKLMNYEKAHLNSMYSGVTDKTLKYMSVIRSLYKDKRYSIGALYTLERALSTTLMLIPSGVFGSLFPDIGLYTHSRIVASLADVAYNSGEEKLYQYMLVDLNGIQRFIYSPLREAAASRVLRGRSIIVQILSHIITDTVLEEYNAPRYSYVVREGGTSLLIVKYDKEKEPSLKEKIWTRLLRALYKDTQGSLLLTLVSSGPIDMKELSKGAESFIKVYNKIAEELQDKITMSKARRDTKLLAEGLLAGPRKIVDNDYVTGEPVFEDDDFKINAENEVQKEYLEEFLPGKIKSGMITGLTHMSLVAGSLARNLRKIIIIDTDEPYKLYHILSGAGTKYHDCNRLYIIGNEGFCDINTPVGLLPFINLKKIVILLSAMDNLAVVEDVENLSKILKCLKKIMDQGVPIGKIIVYNVSNKKLSLGLPSRQADGLQKLSEVVRALEERDTTVIFDYMIMSTHHPATTEANVSRIKGLDEIAESSIPKGIIGTAKIDGDSVGDIIKTYMVYGPSRLAMFSDLMNIAFQVIPLLKLEGSRHKDNLVFLYGGGDDIVVYGGLVSLIKYIGEVYESITSILKPITYTAAIAFDRYRTPILYLYTRTSRLLEKGKASGKGLLLLEHVAEPPPYPRKAERISSQSPVIDMLPGIPLDKENDEYRMLMKIIEPEEDPENKRLLYRISSISSALVEAYNMRKSSSSETVKKSLELELQALLYYSYIVVRLGGMRCQPNEVNCVYEELEKLRKLGLHALPDPPWEAESLEEIAMRLARLKPVIDTFLLILRKTE